jgi:predicted enzyme related to lactoylglutathione lyase
MTWVDEKVNIRDATADDMEACDCNHDWMPLVIDCVLIDCVDLDVMTQFWCGALELEHVWTGPSGGHLLAARDGSDRRLGLMPSRGAKPTKNGVHFDLRPDDQRAEVERLESLGARRVDIGQIDVTWVVMADPEGNEFCVLRSAERRLRDRIEPVT